MVLDVCGVLFVVFFFKKTTTQLCAVDIPYYSLTVSFITLLGFFSELLF